ncbi:neutral zinc metallopeptidase [Amycolatopsis sp. PS_44_ISF1]|uniref:neutral zinc metallopeptidase n=1 Tax=Amycolatopsis sp. PS_44_ISF1 TaxID=2974917 RepID=UPI0028DEF063|nr:neutral zinc metallopeptidase [Amycolatopsis sp. PS_44_ISF1]MDT8915736.1 neutral zinc metallopeptidase [Amycolatopsis sp. PS_44_ISF1]
MSRGGGRALVALALVAALGVAGCGDGGPAGPVAAGAGNVAGLPVTHFDSGLKPGAHSPGLEVKNADGGQDDQLATAAIADVETYWGSALPTEFGGLGFKPVTSLLSYDSNSDSEETACGSVKKLVNAFYCAGDDSVAWDRGVLLPMLRRRFGPMSVVTVLAHEFGHAIQYRLGSRAGLDRSTPTVVKEQQADCFAGSYFRWVAEGKSKYYQVSTAEGLDQVMAAMFFIRDQAGTSATDRQAHGTAFDRTFAFQSGFEKGPPECAGMNPQNVRARLTERPFDQADRGRGDAKLDDSALKLLKGSLDEAFKGAGVVGPAIVAGRGRCAGGPSTPPASYCPADNTVNIDLDRLARLAQPSDPEAEQSGKDSDGLGDFAAFTEVASRYALGVQKGVGASLDDPNAGLRTSCLVGAWAAFTNRPGELRLSAGDLDEGIADLLRPDGLVSADVNGRRADSGFDRVESLRRGYLEGSSVCSKQYG